MSSTDLVPRHEESFLWTLEEIGRLVSSSGNPAETLDNIVHLIQRRFGTDVCSVYLLEPDRANLVLAATVGLRRESVGRVRMRLSEGLAGLVAEQVRPLIVADAAAHPRFKYFPEAGEDPYRSFLGVPIIDRGLLQGVLVVQTIDARTFGAEDTRLLTMAGNAAGADGERGADARPARRARRTSGCRRWRRTCGGAGIPIRPACSARSIRCCGARSTTTRWRCCSRSRSTRSRSGPRSWRCTAASTTPTAASRST